MKTFEYNGFDASGASQKGMIEALGLKHAREKLAAGGILAEHIVQAGEISLRSKTFWNKPVFSLEHRAIFYRELVTLLHAGLPLGSALEMLIQSPEMQTVRPILANIRDQIRDGSSLADAAVKASRKVTFHEKAVIAAGEKAAMLDLVLDRLADHLEEQEKLRERIITALIYPAITLFVGLCIAIGLLGFAVPRISRLLQGVALPLLTRIVMAAGNILAIYGLPLLLIGTAVVFIIWRRIKREPERLRAFEQKLFRLPFLGHAYTLLVNLRFARTLSMLLHGGVPVVESIILAGEATGSKWVSYKVEQEANSIRHGGTIAAAFRAVPPLAASLSGWVEVGEASGKLEQMLDSAGNRLQQQWDRFLARGLALLEPIIIIMTGGFVLLIVLSILLPLMALNRSIM